jgi:hypothetical protein
VLLKILKYDIARDVVDRIQGFEKLAVVPHKHLIFFGHLSAWPALQKPATHESPKK